ncbi:MAG: hypothetical protein ACR2PK_13540, partial [Acidimicrobiales bacterium]
MSRRLLRMFVALATIVVIFLDARPAMAQVVQSESDIEPSTSQTTQLVTSSTEVRRAVYGLLTIALVTLVATMLYWYKTGQQARKRHARQYGGRHSSDPATSARRGRRRQPQPQPAQQGDFGIPEQRPQPVFVDGSPIPPQQMPEYLPPARPQPFRASLPYPP